MDEITLITQVITHDPKFIKMLNDMVRDTINNMGIAKKHGINEDQESGEGE